MRNKRNRPAKQFDLLLIKHGYEALLDEHRRIVYNYEQRIKRDKKLIESQDRIIHAYQENAQTKYLLIAHYQRMVRALRWRLSRKGE